MTTKTKNEQTPPLVTATEKISIQLIDDFPNHPYYVLDDDDMFELTESIRKNGLISPVIVRKKNDRYELVSGHRRKHACEMLGHREIACSIVDITDDEAGRHEKAGKAFRFNFCATCTEVGKKDIKTDPCRAGRAEPGYDPTICSAGRSCSRTA